MEHDTGGRRSEQTRRDLLRKAGLAAGSLVWSTPIVQTLATGVAAAQQGCSDISHLDLVVCRGSGCTQRYAITWDPKGGWSKHSPSNAHCITGSWTSAPGNFSFSGFPTPTFNSSAGTYTLALPADVKVWQAVSKAGQGCQPAVNTSGNTWRFDKWCGGATTTTTSTTSTTTTSSTTTTTTAPTTTSTTTAGGGGTAEGSPGPVQDISHMDLIVRRNGTSGWYGVQYEFGAGWSKHPKGNRNKEHCLFGLGSWSNSAPSELMSQLTSSAVSMGGGRYSLDIPKTVSIRSTTQGFDAFSKCGRDGCRRAAVQDLGANWRLVFSPCPKN